MALGKLGTPRVEARPLGAQPLPRGLERAASKVTDSTAFDRQVGGFFVKSDPTPNIINFAVLLPADFSSNKAKYLQKIEECKPRVTFGETQGRSQFAPVRTSSFPFDPFTLYNSDGQPVIGDLLVVAGDLEIGDLEDPLGTLMIRGEMSDESCNYEQFRDLVEQMARTAAKYTEATSPTYLDKLATTISMLRNHPEYRACRNFAEAMVAEASTRVVPAGRSLRTTYCWLLNT